MLSVRIASSSAVATLAREPWKNKMNFQKKIMKIIEIRKTRRIGEKNPTSLKAVIRCSPGVEPLC